MSNFLEKANITGTSLNLKKNDYYICLYALYSMKRDMFLFLIFKEGSFTFKIHKTDGVSDISVCSCTLLLCPNKIVRLTASLF